MFPFGKYSSSSFVHGGCDDDDDDDGDDSDNGHDDNDDDTGVDGVGVVGGDDLWSR